MNARRSARAPGVLLGEPRARALLYVLPWYVWSGRLPDHMVLLQKLSVVEHAPRGSGERMSMLSNGGASYRRSKSPQLPVKATSISTYQMRLKPRCSKEDSVCSTFRLSNACCMMLCSSP